MTSVVQSELREGPDAHPALNQTVAKVPVVQIEGMEACRDTSRTIPFALAPLRITQGLNVCRLRPVVAGALRV